MISDFQRVKDVSSIADVAVESKVRNVGQFVTEVRSVTSSQSLVRTSEYFENSRTSADTSGYKVVEPGMFAYNPSRINIGSIATSTENEPVIVSPMYVVFSIDQGKVLPAFLMHQLTSSRMSAKIDTNTEVGARFRLPFSRLGQIEIYTPPIAEQRQIVEILDSFIGLQLELEAELEARKKQYELYRDQLLTFAERAEVRWVPMGEVVENLDSRRRPVTRSERESGAYPYYGANGVQDFVSDFIFDGTFLLMGEDGSVIQKNGTPVLNWASGKIWVNNHAHVLKEKPDVVRLRFLYFYLQTVDISSYVTGGTQLKLNQGNLNRINVPIPPDSEQERIVEILDKFDALVNDISIGLPAEIKARRKQYEYYRDKLLTFPEAAA